jgi:hypothetical protein
MPSSAEKLRCVQRELNMRKRLYPRWVAAGKMQQSLAAFEIKLMEEIVEDYRRMVLEERPSLFGWQAMKEGSK